MATTMWAIDKNVLLSQHKTHVVEGKGSQLTKAAANVELPGRKVNHQCQTSCHLRIVDLPAAAVNKKRDTKS